VFTELILTERKAYMGLFHDLENNLRRAVSSSDRVSIVDLVRYSDVLAQENGGKSNVTRILWKAITEAPEALADLILSSLATPFDFDFVDDINGRTCLHEAAIAGTLRLVNICISQGVQVDKPDIYGRSALHYASMNGHADVCRRLLEVKLSPATLDLDNYDPLVYATMRGSVDCVRVLLDNGAVAAQATTPLSNLIPLSLASQSGHVGVVTLLLQHGAHCQPNSNGEYPMHLAAREGHIEVCRLLLGHEGWDLPDKYHEWTPLFHAARYGHAECLELLLEAGSRPDVTDELGHLAVHYAAWYGHHRCVDILLKVTDLEETTPPIPPQNYERSPLSDSGGGNVTSEQDIDYIPSLSLPPPIMPYRVYGHNYLDRTYLVQVSIGDSTLPHTSGVRLHPRLMSASYKDEYLPTSTTFKLVMTTRPDVNPTPYSISLPQREGEGRFAFQISSLDTLSLQFSIYPNFGTKTIGRAIALPSLFTSIENSQQFVLPILDNRLHVIGEVSKFHHPSTRDLFLAPS
jgi:CDK inhibitor PHO81